MGRIRGFVDIIKIRLDEIINDENEKGVSVIVVVGSRKKRRRRIQRGS